MSAHRAAASTEERIGTPAVGLARRSIEELVTGNRSFGGTEGRRWGELPSEFDEPRGVFVTLTHYPSGELRGCVGFPMPIFPLREGIPRAAMAAAQEDPRFPPVSPGELSRLIVEVSILTPPEPVNAVSRDRLPESIVVGRDGLIVDGFGASGLLLPQVAPEQGWNALEFLAGTCEKAGLPPDAWRSPEVQIRRFGSAVFRETSPRGEVQAREL